MTAPSIHLPGATRRAVLVAAALFAAALALFGSAPGPAGAHGGEGELQVVSAERDGDGEAVAVTVRLTYVADGHGVPDATVTAVAGDAAATPLEPGDEEGLFTGSVEAPVGATIRVTSVDPVVSIETEAPPAAPAPTTTGTSPDDDTTTTTGSEPTTEVPATETPATAPGDASRVTGDDDSSMRIAVIGGGVALLGAAGVIAAVVIARKPDGDTAA